jgi:hypothetical protein
VVLRDLDAGLERSIESLVAKCRAAAAASRPAVTKRSNRCASISPDPKPRLYVGPDVSIVIGAIALRSFDITACSVFGDGRQTLVTSCFP